MTVHRIESAWELCHEWVAVWDGSFTETYFTDITEPKLIAALDGIHSTAPSFSLRPMWRDKEQPGQFGTADMIRLLGTGLLAGFSVNYVAALPGLDLRISLLIDSVDGGFFDVDAIWSSKEAFPDGVEVRSRFRDLMQYFLRLHESFGSQRVFVGPENCDDPRDGSSYWVEV